MRNVSNFIFIIVFAISISFFSQSFGQEKSYGKIKVYFNRPVNTTVSFGTNAIYLNQKIDDTLIAYINRTKYTLDIAMYNYIQSSAFSNFATAVNNAYSRGVIVRWIYDGSSSNSSMSNVNSGIKRVASPTGTIYGIMHNKFLIIDANSTNVDDPIVCSGSCNWTEDQINSDPNNAVFLQDKNLALAYTAEFNEMWGSTTATPNATNAKFGPDKTDPLTTHTFVVDGKTVELYFSPTDGTNAHIQSSINTANTDLYFGVYTFTDNVSATAIVNKHNLGVYTAGIMDQYSQTYTPYTTLSNGLGTSLFKVYTQSSSLYHNKFVIVDPHNPTSDPMVLTGSHNWTASANTKNDENTLIIHDATIANVYFQSFYQNFVDLGGTLNPPNTVDIESVPASAMATIFPNPFFDKVIVNINASVNIDHATFIIYDILGNEVRKIMNISDHILTIDKESMIKGIYFYTFANSNGNINKGKLILQ